MITPREFKTIYITEITQKNEFKEEYIEETEKNLKQFSELYCHVKECINSHEVKGTKYCFKWRDPAILKKNENEIIQIIVRQDILLKNFLHYINSLS
jgi:hypothetical protein